MGMSAARVFVLASLTALLCRVLAAQEVTPAPIGESRPALPVAAELQQPFEGVFGRAHIEVGLATSFRGRLLHASALGGLPLDQQLPIDEGSRWLTTAVILSLVDAGRLDLDIGIHSWVAEFDRPDKRRITLRQCLSCTAGFHERVPAAERRDATWDEVAAAIADHPVRSGPGVEFTPSDVGFQVAALAAMRVTGMEWRSIYQNALGSPLGLRQTEFHGLWPRGDAEHATHVPWVGRSAATTVLEFERFCRMLAAGGRYSGRRVLSERSVAMMFQEQVDELTTVRDPGLGGELSYGLGTWLQSTDAGTRGVALGKHGFVAWAEPQTGVAGVVLARDRQERVLPRIAGIQQEIADYIASPEVVGTRTKVKLRHDRRQRHYALYTPPHADHAHALPLVVLLADHGSTARDALEQGAWADVGLREDVVIVCPEARPQPRGRDDTWSVMDEDDSRSEVLFVRAVVDDVKRQVAVDPRRIYAVGSGDGGRMCHRLGSTCYDLFAAVASIGGGMDLAHESFGGAVGAMVVELAATEQGHAVTPGSLQQATLYYRSRNHLADVSKVRTVEGLRLETWNSADGSSQRPMPLCVVTRPDRQEPVAAGVLEEVVWAFFQTSVRD
jgi:CubicO group peptidase (beta-lactamase class C family)